ncbi:ABC transporter permease [Paenibacillus alvei]|uniref:ABC transporter permease n=1 Tax=Paenibacillus alvei TaxID=44250 RepID=A0ABT4H401_PAEAL|nr:ABC transporter permease [Paenibacillus alvei]EJW17153.1 ABC transporter permease protein [Paenibacillus alvei DSM 29]MCY9541493.1 ABC transporter permease [Paenibacillus alvei]MCY9705290.1 ABC transporter permease [Paenibacillus alvei]MCY9735017.1 ABC transporter permease [Paenibacillus alvei]MCY9754240.1 ABC transporter permease [Paenibacillus alvei]
MAKPARSKAWAAMLLLVPSLIVILGVFVLPMLYMFVISIREDGGAGAYTLAQYRLFIQDSYYLEVLWRTIKLSLYTVIVCLLLGYPVAMYMAQATPKMRGFITFLIISPHLISVVIRNFGWVVILGDDGFINNSLISLGVIEKPLRLLYNELGVVIGLADSLIVYMVLAVATSLYAVDASLYKAAGILGASRSRMFFSVTLPLSMPGIFAGTTLVFSLAMSAFVTPALMGGTSVKVMPVIAYEKMMAAYDWSLGAALAFLLLGSTLGLVALFTRMVETNRYKEVFSS